MPASKITTFAIGKGRPPKATRWKPGQSGNPKGRPKGSRNLVTIIGDILSDKIAVEKGGKKIRITIREAIAMRLTQSAMKGDIKSIDYLLKYEPEIERRGNLLSTVPTITSDMDEREAAALYAATLAEWEHG